MTEAEQNNLNPGDIAYYYVPWFEDQLPNPPGKGRILARVDTKDTGVWYDIEGRERLLMADRIFAVESAGVARFPEAA